jgi:hypothetical protein
MFVISIGAWAMDRKTENTELPDLEYATRWALAGAAAGFLIGAIHVVVLYLHPPSGPWGNNGWPWDTILLLGYAFFGLLLAWGTGCSIVVWRRVRANLKERLRSS